MILKISLGQDDGRVNYGYIWEPYWWTRPQMKPNAIPKGLGGELDTSRADWTTGFRPAWSIR